MNVKELHKQIVDKKASGLYLFKGPEGYLMDFAEDSLIKAYIDPSFEAMNLQRFDQGIEPQKVLDSVQTLPFMGSHRLTLVKEADALTFSDQELDQLIKEGQMEANLVVLRFQKATSSLYKKLAKVAKVVTFDKLSENDLRKWIEKQVKAKDKGIEKRALQLFIKNTGYLAYRSEVSLYQVENELRKLLSLPSRHIDAGAVESIIELPLEDNVFSLIDSLAEKRLGRVYLQVEELLEKGHTPYELFPLLTRNYYQIAMAKALLDRGYNQGDIGEVLGVKSSYAVKQIVKRCAKVSKGVALSNLNLCLTAEETYKSTSVSIRHHLEGLLLNLISS